MFPHFSIRYKRRSYEKSSVFVANMDWVSLNLFLLMIPKDISPIIDILKLKYVNHVVNFECSDAPTAISIQKAFMSNHLRISNRNNNSSKDILYSHSKVALLMNSSCDNWASPITYFIWKQIYKSPLIYVIFTEDLSSTVNTLSSLPIEVNSDVTVIHKNDSIFNVFEVYNTGFYTNGEWIVNNIGYFDKRLQFEKPMRMNLTGVVLKGALVVTQKVTNETFEEYAERSQLSKSDTLHKLKYFTLLKYLRDMYNFEYSLMRVNSWGYLRNGSFDGMIGTLQRQETDIGLSPVFYRLERARVLDATIEVWKSRPLFILRHPKHPGGYYTIFTRPLSTRVWLGVLAILGLSCSFLSLLIKLKSLAEEGDDVDTSTSIAVLTILSAICQQGYCITKSATSIKLVIFSTFLFSLTIYQYYNATVVSTLLREPPKNIRTPQDLLQSNLKTGVHDVVYNKDFFTRTTDPIAIEMYNKKIVTATQNNFLTLEHGMALVKRGGFAFLVDNVIAYGVMRNTFTEQEICEAHEISLYPPQNLVAVVRKGSPYREHFAYGLRKMFETGLMQRIKMIWDEPKPQCIRTPDSSLISVSLKEFSTPLVILLAGITLSLLLLCFEILAFKLKKLRTPLPRRRIVVSSRFAPVLDQMRWSE